MLYYSSFLAYNKKETYLSDLSVNLCSTVIIVQEKHRSFAERCFSFSSSVSKQQ